MGVGNGIVPLRIAVLGYGNVARALCKLILEQRMKLRRLGVELWVTSAASRSRGIAECQPGCEGGLNLASLASGGPDLRFRPWRACENGVAYAATAPGDALVELTALEVRSGQPAISHVETALLAGKHVVTANKGPVAWDYARLDRIAHQQGRAFLFEAAVMDGVPIFSLYRRCLTGCEVTGLRGVLNSTTNFILDRMGQGLDFPQALAQAQTLGIAEADPSLDVDGWDAAAKLAALANVLMGASLTPVQVRRRGIRDIGPAGVEAARSRGRVIKLVCEAWLRPGCRGAGGGVEGRGEGGQEKVEQTGAGSGMAGSATGPGGPRQVEAVVEPREVEAAGPLGVVGGTSSVLTISTDLLGDLTLTGRDPQLAQTAYGVLADLIEVARLRREGRG